MNKYRVTLQTKQEIQVREQMEEQMLMPVGQVQQNVNPFSKKRKLDEISSTPADAKRLSEATSAQK